MTLRIGSLCTGYGGLDMAIESVIGGELAWVADNDPGAAAILAHRYPGVPNLDDITRVRWSAVEPVDVLAAGFPCQDISCAGKRAGLREGTRSGLWLHVARAIAELRPPLVVIENVKELLSERADSDMEPCSWCLGDAGPESSMRALGAVLADLAEIGFDAEWVSVPAASAGACHLRWRVFVLAWPAADAGSARRREVAGGAHGDEGQDARRSTEHHNEPCRSGADAPADAAGGRPDGSQDAGAGDGNASARLRGLEPERGRGERPAADTARLGQREPADEADAIAGGRGSRPVPGRRGSGTTADPAGIGRQRHHEPPPIDPDGQSRPGPRPGDRGAPADTERGGRDGRGQEPQRGPEWGTAAAWHRPGAFGRYEAAVRRHERAFGRLVPAPVAPGKDGDPRISPAFTEWMMGLPEGWVTGVPGLTRTAQLKALGNGVVPQQAAAALSLLLDRAGIIPLVAADLTPGETRGAA